MIKSMLLSIMILVCISGFSQVFLLQEFFNNPAKLPDTWKTIDKDGDSYNWRIYSSGTQIYALSDSWRSGGIGRLKPENYLVSPKIDLTGLSGIVKLRYTIQIADPDSVKEHYKVSVSTTGNSATDFTATVFEETCTKDDYYENYPFWHERIVDLTPFLGQNIYITWCHYNCTDLYNLSLDSIQVSYSSDVSLPDQNQVNATVYPNPAKERLLVSGSFEEAQLRLFTSGGRQVFESDKVTKQANIDVSGFKSGLYFLEIRSQKGIIVKKISISH
jgi:hypothetical protein